MDEDIIKLRNLALRAIDNCTIRALHKKLKIIVNNKTVYFSVADISCLTNEIMERFMQQKVNDYLPVIVVTQDPPNKEIVDLSMQELRSICKDLKKFKAKIDYNAAVNYALVRRATDSITIMQFIDRLTNTEDSLENIYQDSI